MIRRRVNFQRELLTGAAGLVLAMVCGPALAGDQPAASPEVKAQLATAQAQSNAAQAPAPSQVTEIVVTGSSIKRVDRETASPVQVLTNVELQHSGYDTISQVLMNVTANGQGAVSSNNSEGFAGGASGVALRGLTVGDTLVLIDGHRMAAYPLTDDGERQFVDLNAIPFDAVDHVEVLKDGASAVYGSDAIAGVVNIILKKNLTGFQASAEGGGSQHGGGGLQHYTLSLGKGDLGSDGYNAYISAEYRSQDAIYLNQRGYQDWAKLNFTSIGGNNLAPGAPFYANSGLPATLTPYLVNPNGKLADASSYGFLGSGCNYTTMTAGQCTFTPQARVMSPSQNLNILGSFAKRFDSGWELNVKASFFDSRGQQNTSTPYGGYTWANSYPGSYYNGQVSNLVGMQPVFNIGNTSYTLPTGFSGPWLAYLKTSNPSLLGANGALAQPLYLEGVLPQIGIPLINFDSQTFRLAADITGEIAGWDVRGSVGLAKVETRVGYENYVNWDNLATDLYNGAFNPLGGNSPAVMNSVAPSFSYLATNSLNYVELNASRKLLHWDGGDLALAVGAEVVDKDLNNPGATQVLNGQVGNTFSAYAMGRQTDTAAYAEIDAHLWRQLELNAALRDDYYDTSAGNSLTPKFGVKWRPNKMFALRGTYSEGFRAPTAAENGAAAHQFGLGNQISDPVLCGTARGQVPADCAYSVPYQQTTNALKPETSRSFTGGFVVEPIRNWSSTFDYYHITIKDQIVSASELSNYDIITPAGDLSAHCTRAAATPIPGVSDGNGNLVTALPNAGPIFCYSGYVNANETTTSGFDFQTQYKFNFFWGSKITTSLSYTHIMQYDLTANGVTYHLAGTHGPSGVSGDTGNPRDRLNASLNVDKGPLNLTATAYWTSSFSITDPSASGQESCESSLLNTSYVFAGQSWRPSLNAYCRVKAFTNINLASTYKLNPHLTLRAEVDNLLDANAPQDMQTYSGSGLPYNPQMHMDGVIGRLFKVGVSFKY